MNTRRSFFSRIGATIATIALAPELAFRARLALPEVDRQREWVEAFFWPKPRSYERGDLLASGITYASNQPFQIPPENYEHA